MRTGAELRARVVGLPNREVVEDECPTTQLIHRSSEHLRANWPRKSYGCTCSSRRQCGRR